MVVNLHGIIFNNTFSTKQMRNIFEEEAFVTKFLEVEAALARAEAQAGIVPQYAATEISDKASIEYLDMGVVGEQVDKIGLFSMSIIEAWQKSFDDAGEYIHWGVTTQDISDTVMVLQLREAIDVIECRLNDLRDLLWELAEAHRETPMIGRTQHVNAPPITFGMKVATWLDEVTRHLDRLEDIVSRLFVVQLFGASGTLASIDDVGMDVLSYFADELDLDVPSVGWTASRDRFAELVHLFALIASTFSKISRQILLLNRPEFGELNETIPGGEIGSSTNPHKRNPVFSQMNVGLAKLVRAHATVMNEVIESFDERDRSTWFIEFICLPESCLYLDRILKNTKLNLEGLEIDAEAMQLNIHRSGTLVASESVMMELARDVGRQTAHEIIHENAMRAIDECMEFKTCLYNDDRVTEHLSNEQIDELVDPTNYLGLSVELVDSVLNDRC